MQPGGLPGVQWAGQPGGVGDHLQSDSKKKKHDSVSAYQP